MEAISGLFAKVFGGSSANNNNNNNNNNNSTSKRKSEGEVEHPPEQEEEVAHHRRVGLGDDDDESMSAASRERSLTPPPVAPPPPPRMSSRQQQQRHSSSSARVPSSTAAAATVAVAPTAVAVAVAATTTTAAAEKTTTAEVSVVAPSSKRKKKKRSTTVAEAVKAVAAMENAKRPSSTKRRRSEPTSSGGGAAAAAKKARKSTPNRRKSATAAVKEKSKSKEVSNVLVEAAAAAAAAAGMEAATLKAARTESEMVSGTSGDKHKSAVPASGPGDAAAQAGNSVGVPQLTTTEQVAAAGSMVSQALYSGPWPSPMRSHRVQQQQQAQSSSPQTKCYTDHQSHMSMVGASILQFCNDTILPSMLAQEAAAAATGANLRSPAQREESRAFLGTLLLLREVLAQNSISIFGSTSDEATDTLWLDEDERERESFAARVLATSVILYALEEGNDAALGAHWSRLFLKVARDYDSGHASFANQLLAYTASSAAAVSSSASAAPQPPMVSSNPEIDSARTLSFEQHAWRHPLLEATTSTRKSSAAATSSSSSKKHKKRKKVTMKSVRIAETDSVHISILQSLANTMSNDSTND